MRSDFNTYAHPAAILATLIGPYDLAMAAKTRLAEGAAGIEGVTRLVSDPEAFARMAEANHTLGF